MESAHSAKLGTTTYATPLRAPRPALPSPPISAPRAQTGAPKRGRQPSEPEDSTLPPPKRLFSNDRCSPAAEPRPASLACPQSFARPYIGHLDLTTASNRAFNLGVEDGRHLSAGLRAPRRMDNEVERMYLKGFANGAMEKRALLECSNCPGAVAHDNQGAQSLNRNEEMPSVPQLGADGIRQASYTGKGNDYASLFTLDNMDAMAPGCRRVLQRSQLALLPDAIVPWVGGLAGRDRRHEDVSADEMLIFCLDEIPRPEGLSRSELARDWPPALREAAFALGEEGFWFVPERYFLEPTDVIYLRDWVAELSLTKFPHYPPLQLTTESDIWSSTQVAFISGVKDQITTLVDGGTWSTTRGCFFAIPNRDLESGFTCTYAGIGIPREEHRLAFDIIKDTIASSEKIEAALARTDTTKQEILQSLRLEFVRVLKGLEQKYGSPPDDRSERSEFFWNVYMNNPTNDRDELWEWRSLIASLRPGNDEIGFMWSTHRFFWCLTCGSINHPDELCPTMFYPKWLGSLPEIPM